jgi:hypothetical protein
LRVQDFHSPDAIALKYFKIYGRKRSLCNHAAKYSILAGRKGGLQWSVTRGLGFPQLFSACIKPGPAQSCAMPKRSSKDLNEVAIALVQQASGQNASPPQKPEKNPAAVALGRLGGLKGGKARAEKLSQEQRTEIAKLAALRRWRK